MKILILGAKGLLGSDLASVFSKDQVIAWDKEDLDISNASDVKEKISILNPEVIINAAAYTAVDACESCRDAAMDINGKGPKFIASVCKDIGGILVHISTDYVFSGSKREGYFENDEPAPINIYGQSKVLGEKNIIEVNPKFYLVRTSWLFGKNGKNFVYAMLNLSQEFNSLTVVNDRFGKPTYTKDLAERIKHLIENNFPFGIYHITNETKPGGISWYDFAQKIFEIKKINVNIKPIISEQFPRPALRPKYSALNNSKLEPMRNWQEALEEFFNPA